MVKNILVVQTAYLGDLLLAIPLLKRIRDNLKPRKLTLLCRAGLGEYFRVMNLVDEVVEVDKKKGNWREVKEKLNAFEYDYIFSPHQSFRTAMFIRSLKSPCKVGFRTFWNGPFFHHRIERPMGLPDALRQLSLLRPFDRNLDWRFGDSSLFDHLLAVPSPLNSMKVPLKIPDWASMRVEGLTAALIERNRKAVPGFEMSINRLRDLIKRETLKNSVLLAPGSQWPTKMWPAGHYQKLGERLSFEGQRVVLIGHESEAKLCSRIAEEIPNSLNLAGKLSVFETIEIMRRSRVLICNDSGAMHMAAVAGLPTLAIFGPTTLQLGYRPWQDEVRIAEKNLKCRPCGRHGAKRCPIKTHECMKEMSPIEVRNQMEILINPKGP